MARHWKLVAKLLFSLVLLDQLLFWTLLTQPAASLRSLIALTGRTTPPYYRLQPNLAVPWTLWRPEAVTKIHTNSLGLRAPERPLAKPPGVRRVVLMGDSITFGAGVDDADALGVQLQTAVTATAVEVWNAGVPGYAMADFAGQLPSQVLPLQPDLLVLQLSRNDSLVPMALSPVFLGLLRVSGLARAYMILRFNRGTDHSGYAAALAAYLQTARDAGVPVLIWPEGVPERQNAELSAIAARFGAEVRALHAETLARLDGDPHLSAAGTREAARRLWPLVQRRLEGAAPQSDYP